MPSSQSSKPQGIIPNILTIPGARHIPTSLLLLHPPLIPPPHRAPSQASLTGCQQTGKQKLQHAFCRQAGTSTKQKANKTEFELWSNGCRFTFCIFETKKHKKPSPCTIILTSKFIFFIFPNLIIIPLSYNQITEPNTMISCRCWLVSASCMNKTCDCGVKLKFANHALVFLSFSEMLLLVFWWWVKLMPSSGKLHAAPKAPAPQGHQSF